MDSEDRPEKLAARTRAVADAWMLRMLDRLDHDQPPPHRQDCVACPASGLLAALGGFAALPHHLVHPLIRQILGMVDDEEEHRLDAAQARLEQEWRDGLHLIEGDPPEWYWYSWYSDSFRDAWQVELVVAAELRRASLHEAESVLAAFAREHADVARTVLDRMLGAIEDVTSSAGLLDARARSGLGETIREVVEDWCAWLSTGEWASAHRIPTGSRCSLCAAVGIEHLGAHGAAHELAAAVEAVEERFIASFAVPRIEPPGEGALELVRAEVRSAVRADLASVHEKLRRAMDTYVTPGLDRMVGDASRWIDTGDSG